jgi:flavin-dependent dehydrogenase
VPVQAFDVVIVGGGPAGCAAGLSLRSHAPALAVAIVEASASDEPRVGETLPPPVRGMLVHLGVWAAFQRQGHRESPGTSAVWGAAEPRDTDFLFAARGNGWHLDRAAFDAMLAAEAERHGVAIIRPARLAEASRDGSGWRLRLSVGQELGARFVVDATGAAAAFARRQGARFLAADQLTGFARFFDEPAGGDPRILVEAFADGWWYTAGLPGGRRIAACLTDADLARRLRLGEPDSWSRLLAATDRVRKSLRDANPCGPVLVRATPSRRLDPVAGDDWLAVGDAAALFDPLSSSGIFKALRSGIFAGYAIGDLLTQGDGRGLERYRRLGREEFASYSTLRARHYGAETRWPESEFWRRRGAPCEDPGTSRPVPKRAAAWLGLPASLQQSSRELAAERRVGDGDDQGCVPSRAPRRREQEKSSG